MAKFLPNDADYPDSDNKDDDPRAMICVDTFFKTSQAKNSDILQNQLTNHNGNFSSLSSCNLLPDDKILQ